MTDPAFDPPPPIAMPHAAKAAALARDYLELDWLFTPEELALRDRVRAFVDWLAALIADHDGIQLRSMLP